MDAREIRLVSVASPEMADGATYILLEADGARYEYHGREGTVLLVSSPLPRAGDPGSDAPAEASRGPVRPLDPDETRVLGELPDADVEGIRAIAAPDSVSAGQEFAVTVTTLGSGCERAGDVGLVRTENAATALVYDYTRANRPGVVCTMVLKYLRHDLRLSFTRPGEAVIRVWGRRSAPGAAPFGVPVVIEHRVLVR